MVKTATWIGTSNESALFQHCIPSYGILKFTHVIDSGCTFSCLKMVSKRLKINKKRLSHSKNNFTGVKGFSFCKTIYSFLFTGYKTKFYILLTNVSVFPNAHNFLRGAGGFESRRLRLKNPPWAEPENRKQTRPIIFISKNK